MRKSVYDKAIEEGLTEERAIVMCNIFKNAYFMGCGYPDSILIESKRYWPKEALDNPLYEEI